ncbi:hypothetical protein WJX72_012524 [[Myrmecia] bisecta]|uniref:Elongator complex protein 5 n=1 Tax=[Myrmecia] bisecta TaxID=41462 RepID=A0AAW1PYN2_9CHLO
MQSVISSLHDFKRCSPFFAVLEDSLGSLGGAIAQCQLLSGSRKSTVAPHSSKLAAAEPKNRQSGRVTEGLDPCSWLWAQPSISNNCLYAQRQPAPLDVSARCAVLHVTRETSQIDSLLVGELVRRLQREPSVAGILAVLHTDLVEPALLCALHKMAAAVVRLDEGAFPGTARTSQLDVRAKRQAGRHVRATDAHLNTGPAADAAQHASPKWPGMASDAQDASMRARVTLPYEHHMLPAPADKVPAAGCGPSIGRLGSVTYLRESDTDLDSDEDPDDDLVF